MLWQQYSGQIVMAHIEVHLKRIRRKYLQHRHAVEYAGNLLT